MSEDNDSAEYQISVGRNAICSGKIKDPTTAVGQMSATDECLRRASVRIGTMLKIDNVSFLLGAGISIDAGGITLGTIPISIEEQLVEVAKSKQTHPEDAVPSWLSLFYETTSALSGKKYSREDRHQALSLHQYKELATIELNLEEYLSQLYAWYSGMVQGVQTIRLEGDVQLTIHKGDLDLLIKAITSSLVKLLQLPKAGIKDPLRVHRKFMKRILTRSLNLRRANIFTLNYDTLLEQAADTEGIMLVDGFMGTLHRTFRPESYDMDFYFPAQTTEGRVHRFDRALHLYKLHGSVSWHGSAVDGHLYAASEESSDDVLIFPTGAKYGQTLAMPYSELFRRFSNTIAQPQSVLFAIGYGFGDGHVNTLIRQALAIPSFTLIVVDPKPSSEFVARLRESEDERIWIVEGALGYFQSFVESLLPDLHEEEIDVQVALTLKRLSTATQPGEEEAEVDVDGK